MKKILVLLVTALFLTVNSSAYAFFPKAPANNAAPFDSSALVKKQTQYLLDYKSIINDLADAYILIAEAVVADKNKDKVIADANAMKASNTETSIKEINKTSTKTSKEIEKSLKKAKELDDNQKKLLAKATVPYLSANGKMALLTANVALDATEIAKAIKANPAQAITIKSDLNSLLMLADVLPGYSKINVQILDMLISTLEKNGVDMSKQKKQKEATQSQGAE